MALKMLFRTEEGQGTEILGQVNSEKSRGWWASTLARFSGSNKVATMDGDFISNGPKGKVETMDKDQYKESFENYNK